ncbi:hypothetical protein LTR37_010544 [Vermiconidia calcicola]|uniref:Uncharacterized protein n=1 Tax=Vermiconidia calcicola TaxID=1690605 RepID=A0ACC3N5I1_9PEZI|nr:hypothetical protein LTR37_010544 [Vermiconidia calcicola]
MIPVITWRKDRPPVERKTACQHKLADAPEWTIISLEVSYPPDGSTPPHRHGGANVFAYVLEGEVLSGMNDEEPEICRPGESWYEPPGCRHRVSDNNSTTERAKFMATFLIKTEVLEREGPGILVQIEPEYLAQM